jgi:hypothetical protein
MHQMTAEQKLQIERDMDNQVYEYERDLLQKKADCYASDSAEYQKVSAQIEKLDEQHSLQMQKNATQTAAIVGKSSNSIFAGFLSAAGSMSSAWDRSLSGMMNGSMSWAKAQTTMLGGLVSSFAKYGENLVSNEIKSIAQRVMAHTAGDQAMTASSEMASIEQTAISAATAAKQILANAWTAMSGAYAAISSIVPVGPFMAPAVAAGTFGAVAGLASHVAEGGFDVPAGVNPVTQLHQSEMVLPAHLADNVRNMTGGGGSTSVHIHATDSQSVSRLFNQNGSALMQTIKRQMRGGGHGSFR